MKSEGSTEIKTEPEALQIIRNGNIVYETKETPDCFNKVQAREKHLSHVVSFGSEEHKKLYCLADKVITAYIEKNNYLPFTNEEYAKFMDVASMPEIIYFTKIAMCVSVFMTQ